MITDLLDSALDVLMGVAALLIVLAVITVPVTVMLWLGAATVAVWRWVLS